MVECSPESVESRFSTLGEAIESLRTRVPADIWERYFTGSQWREIVDQTQTPLGTVVSRKFMIGGLSFSLAKLLAAYVINIVSQGLCNELILAAKVDSKTRQMVQLTAREKIAIEETIRILVNFVQNELGISVIEHPEVHQPFVQLP